MCYLKSTYNTFTINIYQITDLASFYITVILVMCICTHVLVCIYMFIILYFINTELNNLVNYKYEKVSKISKEKSQFKLGKI